MSLQVVSTVRRDNVQFFTKRRFSALFWPTRTSPGANFSHRSTCMYTTFHIRNHVRDHWLDPREGLWCVFTVINVHLRNFLTYMDVPACKFSHERTCLYTTCPIISYVWARTTCFPRSVSNTRHVHARVHTLKDRCLLTLWVTKSFLRVTLNIWHHFGHQIFHRQVETMYSRMT